jgi:dolichyl-phosphate-mannose--protein O-mannosyl transferase
MTEIKFTLPTLSGFWSLICGLASRIDILHISIIGAAFRLFIIGFPNDGLVFDEIHYHNAALSLLQGVAANAEHPPLVKLFAALSIKLLGDFWFSWRIPIVLFAVFLPYLIYRLGWKLTGNKTTGLYAAAFSLFDIILFIHGNILMLEIPALVFGLVFVLLYLDKRYGYAALTMSLSFLCNEKALWLLLGVAIYHIWTHLPANIKEHSMRVNAKSVGIFVVLCLIFGGGGFWLNDLMWRPVQNTTVGVGAQVIVYPSNGTMTTTTTLVTNTSYEYITDPIHHVL